MSSVSFSAPTDRQLRYAEALVAIFPSYNPPKRWRESATLCGMVIGALKRRPRNSDQQRLYSEMMKGLPAKGDRSEIRQEPSFNRSLRGSEKSRLAPLPLLLRRLRDDLYDAAFSGLSKSEAESAKMAADHALKSISPYSVSDHVWLSSRAIDHALEHLVARECTGSLEGILDIKNTVARKRIREGGWSDDLAGRLAAYLKPLEPSSATVLAIKALGMVQGGRLPLTAKRQGELPLVPVAENEEEVSSSAIQEVGDPNKVADVSGPSERILAMVQVPSGGVPVNDNPRERVLDACTVAYQTFRMTSNGAVAYGQYNPEDGSMTVLPGSTMAPLTRSLEGDGRHMLREEIMNADFAENIGHDRCKIHDGIVFCSPSGAASIMMGRNVNGPKFWLDRDGNSLCAYVSSEEMRRARTRPSANVANAG